MTSPNDPRGDADALSPESWAHVRALVEDAVAVPPQARGAFLSSSCGDDDGLRRRVERLVAACDRADGSWGFLAHSAGELAAPLFAADQAAMADLGRTDGAPAAFCAALADRYAVGAVLGRGGMAAVYGAEDLRHHRRVAIKVLDPHLGAMLGAERFLSEIRVTANLQHPNLLPLFDSGEAVGLLYYVMPLIQGATLRARLRRERQLPVDEAVRIVCAVASALDYAHRQGVVHRDLKPENILLQDGQPLVADFGIALAVSKAGGARVTQTGMSLGTPQYMSPEQATGDRVIDGRSDVYSLAAVAYETLTGEPPHAAATAQAILARVLTERTPSVRATRPAVPEHVDLTLQRALAKLPADRWPTAATFATALVTSGRTTPHRAGTYVRRVLPWAVVPLALATGVWAARRATAVPDDEPVVRVAVDLQPGERLYLAAGGSNVAISPQGDRLVYVGQGTAGVRLMIRRTDEMNARELVSTVVTQPAFSHDGRWVVYSDGSQIKRVSVDGGSSLTLANIANTTIRGFAWMANDTILIGSTRGMFALPSQGGVPRRVFDVDSTAEAAFPVIMPDGKTIAYTAGGSGTLAPRRLAVTSLASHRTAVFDTAAMMALGMLERHLIYVTSRGELSAVPFDLEGLRLTGDPIQLESGIRISGTGGKTASLSASGSLWFVSGASTNHLVRVTPGRPDTRLIDEARAFRNPRFSPNGQQIAVEIVEPKGTKIWLYDLASGTFTPFTDDGSVAEWSGDGKRVLFRVTHDGKSAVMWQPADGSSKAELLYQPEELVNEALLSADGKWLVYRTAPGLHNRDIYAVPLDGDRKPVLIAGGATHESHPRLSPDGKWLAYQSNESGRFEIYVRPFPSIGARVPVSSQGGAEPVWARSGNGIFYRTLAGGVEYASVRAETRFTVGERRAVLPPADYLTNIAHASYDVWPNDSGFLMLKPVDGDDRPIFVHNWVRSLREKVAAVP